jgi:hypothetical protein
LTEIVARKSAKLPFPEFLQSVLAINDAAGNDKLMFTAKVWTPGEDTAPKVGGKVGTYTENEFPFLDMELTWSDNGTLKFGTHETEPTTQVSQRRECSYSWLFQSNQDQSVLPPNKTDYS